MQPLMQAWEGLCAGEHVQHSTSIEKPIEAALQRLTHSSDANTAQTSSSMRMPGYFAHAENSMVGALPS